MSMSYYFKHLESFKHLEIFLSQHTEDVLEGFFPGGRFSLNVKVSVHENESKGIRYVCSLRVQSPELHSPIIINKSDGNFYRVVRFVEAVLKKILRRHSAQRYRHGGSNKWSRMRLNNLVQANAV